MGAEKKVEQTIVRWVKSKGGVAYKFSSPGNRGVPDRIVIFDGGRIAFLEVKSATGKPSKLQLKKIQGLKNFGFIAAVVSSLDETKTLLEPLVEK